MDLAEYKGVYVIAEQFEGKLRNVSFELLGQGRKLADGIGDEVGAVLIGYNVKPLAQELIAHGAHKVYVYDDEKLANYNTTAYSKVLCDFFHEVKPNVFLVGATNIGRDLGPRVANSLKTGLTADCTGLSVDEDGKTIVWTRPALGGNIMAEIICRITVRRWVLFVRTYSKNRKLIRALQAKLSKWKQNFPTLTS